MKKKFLALVLSFVLVIGASFNVSLLAFAEETSVNQENITQLLNSNILNSDILNEQEDKILTDVDTLNSRGIPANYLTNISTLDNDIVYTYTSENVESNIIVTNLNDGAIKYLITENDLENEVIITADGQIILDGYEVKINKETNEINEINTRAGSQIYDIKDCPYGKASDYTIHKGDENVADISIGQFWENVTIGAVTLIISSYAGCFVPVAGFELGVSYAVATALVTSGRENNPKSTSLSYKIKRYYHKSGKFAVNGTLCVQKMDGTFYTQAAYGGKGIHQVYYNCKEYY